VNQSTRWKRFIDWWGEEKFVGLSKEETLDLIQERIDDLRRPK
jgi:hypothetical protein